MKILFDQGTLMPAKDLFHEKLKAALLKDGWTVTDDPLSIKLTKQTVFVDLGAERPLAAEKEGRKIAVEIKGYNAFSPIYAIQRALGQYLFYRYLVQKRQPERVVWLALPKQTLELFEQETEIGDMMRHYGVYRLIYDADKETIVQWIEPNATEP